MSMATDGHARAAGGVSATVDDPDFTPFEAHLAAERDYAWSSRDMWRERALAAEARVRDLEETVGELVALDDGTWRA
jgi:hypothetical protein